MGDEIRSYIDGKFDRLNNNLKWIGTGLIVLLMSMGGMVVANTVKVSNHDFEMRVIGASQDQLEYQLSWIIELQEIQRNFLKAIQSDNKDEVSQFLDQLKTLEQRVYSGQPMPTFRGAKP